MMQAASTAKMALIAQQTRLDVVANNIANVNTSGFKGRQVTFKDMLYTTMMRPTNNQEGNLQKGTGVMVASTDLFMRTGIPEMTEMPLDFCIDGDGLFAVRGAQGETLYTRNGKFVVSVEEDGNYIVTTQGYYALDDEGERISIPVQGETEEEILGNISTISVDTDGSLCIGGMTESFAKLGLYWFPNAAGLDSVGNTCFAQNDASGEPIELPAGSVVLQGYLEASNVDMSTEMINMMKTQSAFAFASKAITTADEMDALANNMRA